MIPRGRPVVDAAGAAELLGMSAKTFRNRLGTLTGFPAPVNPGRRKALYDLEQVVAYRDGRALPELPAGEHDDDLLDDKDAAAVLGVEYATVRKDRDVGRLPGFAEVLGVPHIRRADLARVREQMRPGRGVGGGRPRGSTTREEER